MPEPRQKIIMPFGKYKGKEIREVPRGYLIYMYDRNLLTGEVKKYAEENIPILSTALSLKKKKT